MKNLKNRIKTPCVDNYVESYLIKTEKIFKLSSYKNNFSKNGIKCLVTDYHSDLNWYDNGRNTVNSLRINKNFYNLILDLSNKF